MRRAAPVLVALFVAAALAPPAQAHFHFFSWTAQGIAVAPDGRVATATITWHGGGAAVLCEPTFEVTLEDLAGAYVIHQVFYGYEEEHEIPLPESTLAEVLVVDTGSSEPGTSFHLHGPQVAFFPLSQMTQHLTGTYNEWQLVATTALSVLQACA